MTGAEPVRPASPRPALLAMVLVWMILFAPQILAGRAFVLGDTADLRAYAEFSAERWRERRERTHWTPYLYGGLATTASLADFRPQFLPDALLDAYDAAHRLPAWPPLALPLLAHLAGMLATAGLARGLWSAGPTAMAWAGISWGLMPNLLVPFTFGHDPQLMAVSFLPVTLLAVHHAIADARPSRGALALALALALQFLAQYPQIVLFVVPLAAAFALERAWAMRRPERLAWVAGAAFLGAAMSSTSWWPAFLYNRHSIRGAAGGIGPAEVAAFSLAPRDLLSVVWPWAMGFGGGTYWGGMRATDFPQYLGAPAVVLAALGLGRGHAGRPPGARFFATVAATGMVLALGTNLGPVHAFLSDRVPLWSSFRLPVNAMILAQLAVALLSARSLDSILVRNPGRRQPASGKVLMAAASIMVVGALAVGTGPLRGAYTSALLAARPRTPAGQSATVSNRAAADLALRGLLTGAVPALLALSARLPAAGLVTPLLGGVLLLDLGTVNAGFLRRATGDLRDLMSPEPPMVARLAAADPGYRAMALRQGQFFSNQWIRWRARSVSGFHPAVSLAWADLRRAGLLGQAPVMRALAIRYVSGEVRASGDTALFEPVADSPPGDPVWRVRGACRRASAVPRVVIVDGESAVLAALGAPGFDPSRQAICAEAAAGGEYPGSERCDIRWVVDDTDRLVLDTDAPAPAFLVIADAFFPGWSARVDGREAMIHRVDHMLRGVAMPAGRHRLTLSYEPEGWRAATRATRAAWAVWIALAVLGAGLARGGVIRFGTSAGP